jgi:hypothetical protein
MTVGMANTFSCNKVALSKLILARIVIVTIRPVLCTLYMSSYVAHNCLVTHEKIQHLEIQSLGLY